MTQEYEEQAAAAERELADMEERGARVEEHIEEARKEWEAKVADPSVPGAGGNPDRADNDRDADTASRDVGGELPPPDPYETD